MLVYFLFSSFRSSRQDASISSSFLSMSHTYSSTYLQGRSQKIAFLIDCVDGLSVSTLTPELIGRFPSDSDIFLFYYREEPGINRRLKRLENNLHGVFFFPTEFNGIATNISFILGLIADKYENFVIVTQPQAGFHDLCSQLIEAYPKLRNHLQQRSFGRFNEFEQFLDEFTRLHSEQSNSATAKTAVLHYNKNALFHSCPLETAEESSIVYRFAELLHHLDSEHEQLTYDYCRQCQQMVNEQNFADALLFEDHIQNDHWDDEKGFQLSIHSRN